MSYGSSTPLQCCGGRICTLASEDTVTNKGIYALIFNIYPTARHKFERTWSGYPLGKGENAKYT